MMIYTAALAQSQITGIYSIDRFDANSRCNLYLYENGNYFFELSENVTDDIVVGLVISCGKFSVTKHELRLIDEVHNFELLFIIDNKSLKVKQAFSFLRNKCFIFYGNNYDDGSICTDINTLTLQEERSSYKTSHKTIIPLFYGVYESGGGFKLVIKPNNKYLLEYKSVVLSEGRWCRDGNEMELIDFDLKHPFYALINDKMLISKLLPGDYIGISLFKR